MARAAAYGLPARVVLHGGAVLVLEHCMLMRREDLKGQCAPSTFVHKLGAEHAQDQGRGR